MDINVIFWGTGKTAERFVTNHSLFVESVNVVGFTDTDSGKWGTGFRQYKIAPPFVILEKSYDYIVILSIYYNEIRDTLVKEYSVSQEKVLPVDKAYELYFQQKCITSGTREFRFPQLLAGLSVSNSNYICNLKEINEFISYLYLKEKYLSRVQATKIDKNETGLNRDIIKSDTPIWVCWLQGIGNAPDIVRCCINSLRRNVEGIIHIITYENLSDYIVLEEAIVEKHKSGLISATHFSDIVRLALLYKYGGIWVDASILLMDSGLPDYAYELPLFMYKIRTTMDEGYKDPRKFSSWFISAQKENPLIGMVYDFLNYYWSSESAYPYYLMHYFMRMAWDIYENPDKDKLIIYNCNCRLLYKLLNKTYDESLWKMIKEEQPMQKLTYKQNFIADNTFYGHIRDIYL